MNVLPTILAGLVVCLGGAALGIKQMLSHPSDQPNYPSYGPWARFVMFWLSAFLIARGLEIVVLALRPQPLILSGFAVGASFLVSAYFANELYVHATQKTSARTQRLIGRLHAAARCAKSDGVQAARLSALESGMGDAKTVPDAVAALRRSGVVASAPNEGPEAFTGPWQ